MSLRQRAALTDPGRKRRRNEDSYVLEPPLFAVADGMGGAQAGELASSLAAEALRDDPILFPGPDVLSRCHTFRDLGGDDARLEEIFAELAPRPD